MRGPETPHGDGIRRYASPVSARASIAWRSGAAELLCRELEGETEVSLVIRRHAILFTFEQPLGGWSETLYAGRILGDTIAHQRSLSIIPANGEYRARTAIKGASRYMAIFLDPRSMLKSAELDHLNGLELLPSWGLGDPMGWRLAEALRQECEAGAVNGTLFAETAATMLSLHLLRHHSNLDRQRSAPARGGLAPRQFARVTDYIMAHLAEDISLSELAAIVDMSESHFCRAFKASAGRSPHKWRVERRIERACEFLLHCNLPIAEIATLCGFTDQSHFGSTFRAAVGFSPAVWRRDRKS